MLANELRDCLTEGGLSKYKNLYSDVKTQTERMISVLQRFEERFGQRREVYLLSVPGRTEILGNHTDHNKGCVLAGAIDRDMIAVASPNEDGVVRFLSEGYPEDIVELWNIEAPEDFKDYSSSALIAGVAQGFLNEGYSIGGYDVYAVSDVLKGSGISSSAAYEVMIGNLFNYLYNDGEIDNRNIAKICQYAENAYFGKPCGLMDQIACAVGGFVFIDFEDGKNPTVEPIAFSLSDNGYALCIVNTGGNHADLNEDYASIPREMRAVASELGGEVLRPFTEEEIIKAIPSLRARLGDRALLRALHYVRENVRVNKAKNALKESNIDGFLTAVGESARSSFEYLQNVYTNLNIREQGLSLALALTDGYLAGKRAAFRVHGGGFAGTIQVFLPRSELDGYVKFMDRILGDGSAMALNIRPLGACRLF